MINKFRDGIDSILDWCYENDLESFLNALKDCIWLMPSLYILNNVSGLGLSPVNAWRIVVFVCLIPNLISLLLPNYKWYTRSISNGISVWSIILYSSILSGKLSAFLSVHIYLIPLCLVGGMLMNMLEGLSDDT